MPVLKSIFNKVTGSQACNFIKKRLQHRCFPDKFSKFLRTPRWLLLKQLPQKISSAVVFTHDVVFPCLFKSRVLPYALYTLYQGRGNYDTTEPRKLHDSDYGCSFVAKLSWKKNFFLKKYLCFYKIYIFCRKKYFYMEKKFYNEKIFLLKKTFFTEKNYILFQKYIFTQKKFVLQIKYESFLNICSFRKKFFF